MKARVDYELEVEEWFIKQVMATYEQEFPGVPDYWRSAIAESKEKGYAETFAGRRVQLPNDWAGQTKWPNESTAINYPIQGTGGDQKYLALAVARNELNKWGAHFYYELHDGLFFITPNKVTQAFREDFKPRLSNLPYKGAWGVDLPISFPVDAKQGPTWGDLR
jgi:DNA polymerase I-like protein with 3'-5' exonuclease and polymerase domains